MKKILYIFPTLKPGGAEKVAIQIANFLAVKYRYEITFFVCDASEYYLESISDTVRILRINKEINEKPKLPFWYHYYLRCGVTLFSICRKEKFDIIVAIHEQVPEVIASISKVLNASTGGRYPAAYVSIIASNLSALRRERTHATSRMMFHFLALIRRRIFDVLVVLTRKSQQELLPQGRKIVRIPNPLDLKTLTSFVKRSIPGYPPVDSYVIVVARIIKQKNHMLILRAFNSVRNRVRLNVVMIGHVYDSELNDALHEYVQTNDLTSRVSLLGAVPNPYQYMVNAKAIVLLSDYEGMPLSLLEAMALNVPIITTKYDGYEEYFNERNALLVERNSVHELADALLTVDFGGPEIQKRTAQAYEESKQFDVNIIGERYHEMFSGTGI